MSREFKCAKCEGKDINVVLKDYVSHIMHDERVPEFLACGCRKCGNRWREKPSDSKDEELT